MSLQIQSLCVRLGKSEILHDVNLEVPKGSFFSLLGPSGCGKSTLLKTIAGLLPQAGGHIFWNGQAIDSLPPEKRGMVMVFQDLRLFPHMTVLDNVAFPFKVAGIKKSVRHRDARGMLSMVQLSGLENRRPHQLSGGQQQRAVLARALVAKPKVLLMDEPFSSLDAPLRADMRGLLLQLHKQLDTTMVLVTHDQEEALALSDKMAVMDSGYILQEGTPSEIYRHPSCLAVAKQFIRGNHIEGYVTKRRFVGSGLAFELPDDKIQGAAVALLPVQSIGIKAGTSDFTVTGLEYAGSHMNIILENEEIQLRAKLSADQSNLPGKTVGIEIDTSQVYIFPKN